MKLTHQDHEDIVWALQEAVDYGNTPQVVQRLRNLRAKLVAEQERVNQHERELAQ